MLPVLIGIGVVALGGFLASGCGGEGAHLNYPPDSSSPPTPDASTPPPPPPVNTPPQISVTDRVTAYQGFPVDIPITASDREGGDVRVEVDGLPSTRSSFRIVEQRAGSTRANLRWGSSCTASVGEYTARIRATDEGGVSSEREVSINLRPATAITGEYEVRESLTLCNGIYNGLNFLVTGFNLTLDGNGSTLIASSSATAEAIRVAGRFYDVTVQNFNTRDWVLAFSFSGGAQGVTVRNLNAQGFRGATIYGGANQVRVENSSFRVSDTSLAVEVNSGAHDVDFSNVAFVGPGATPMGGNPERNLPLGLVSVVGAFNVVFDRCNLSGGNNTGGLSIFGGSGSSTYGIRIRNSVIERNRNGGIVMGSGARAIIENNTIRDNFTCGIRAIEGATYTESGNTITGHTQSYCSR